MILGIETSCDETSVALLERDGSVRINLIASQIDRHQPFCSTSFRSSRARLVMPVQRSMTSSPLP
jgi:tRNA A37 threonylcarbamoyltransferase TsaD